MHTHTQMHVHTHAHMHMHTCCKVIRTPFLIFVPLQITVDWEKVKAKMDAEEAKESQ